MPGLADPDAGTWLVFVYQLPAKSAGLRRLTAIGAVHLARAAVPVPSSVVAERALRAVRHLIADAGGLAVLLRGWVAAVEQETITTFNAARDREYQHIAAACDDAVACISAKTAAGDFGYDWLPDQEAELKQLTARLAAARGRDLLSAGQADAAVFAVAEYWDALDEYAKCVCAADA